MKHRFGSGVWKTKVFKEALGQPFKDLFNRPSGGEAYCGGIIFNDPQRQLTLRHFRGLNPIDRPLTRMEPHQKKPITLEKRQFWCGPLSFHFGHQIADFGSRVLLSSLDLRDGELLWFPWKTGSTWDELLPWQTFILKYLNPGNKAYRISTVPLYIRELVVVPQQARMRASPTVKHLEGLRVCERVLGHISNDIVYVSRAKFAACVSLESLTGSFAGEALFESMLQERGVTIIHPESLSLREQLEIYKGSRIIIFAEGSAQHCLELLSVHSRKQVVVICRRPQISGMDLPLRTRFPLIQFVEAVTSLWHHIDGVEWNGIALLNWEFVACKLNPFLPSPLTESDCQILDLAGKRQLFELSSKVDLSQSKH